MSLLCFNGAVTFSLRKLHNHGKKKTKAISLQWGRNFFVTEITGPREEENQELSKLQWGRNFFVTEI